MIERIKKSIQKRGILATFKLGVLFLIRTIKKLPRMTVFNTLFHIKKNGSCDDLVIRKIKGNGYNKMILNLKDKGISKELLITGYHEKNSSEFMKKELKEGMRIIEIGGNIGYYTLLEAKIIGKSGHIHVFEPDPINMKYLKLNVAINDYDDICDYYSKAVGNENKQVEFYSSNFGNLGSLIQRDDKLCKYDKIDVKMVRLDDKLFGEKIDYFRMDVEGFEMEIIKSMDKILSSPDSPYGMFIEVHSKLLHKIDSSALDFINKLRSYGYEIKKSFWRGKSKISVNNTEDFINHHLREEGYWETFFYKK